jgi:hypothetical protein
MGSQRLEKARSEALSLSEAEGAELAHNLVAMQGDRHEPGGRVRVESNRRFL